MRILFLGPLPEPLGGHSLACQVFLDALVKDHRVDVVNLNKMSFKEGIDSIGRIIEVMKILFTIWRKQKDVTTVYLTIAESFAGNIKDIFIYLLCFRHLPRFYIHLHGGSIKRLLWDRSALLRRLNAIFIRRMAGVIISGRSHLDIFYGMIERNRIHIVPNFAQDFLFLTRQEIVNKFSHITPLRVLFLSNFAEKKGFNELVDAYFLLSEAMKGMVKFDFAGRFESKSQEGAFLRRIEGIKHIHYHGIVDSEKKRSLFAQAHIFCLPTAFLEGQPISILEAYASGCVVVTTGQSGIRDVFTDGVNGFEVQERSGESIKNVLDRIRENPERLLTIAISNRTVADEKYRTSTYSSALISIIDRPTAN